MGYCVRSEIKAYTVKNKAVINSSKIWIFPLHDMKAQREE
jgi:hypothetical protein